MGIANRLEKAHDESYIAPILVALSAFLFYVFLSWNYPALYWGDAHVRMALRDQILLGHWLPLFQILLSIITALTDNVLVVRGCLALIACSALVSCYHLARTVFTPPVGIIAMILLAVNPIFAALAIVPYAESLFTLLIFLALLLLRPLASTRQLILGAIFLNLACLTRYEGWLLSLVIIIESVWLSFKARKLTGFAKAALSCAIAPLLWLLFIAIQPGDLGNEINGVLANVRVMMTGPESSRTFSLGLNSMGSFFQSYSNLLLSQMTLWIILLGIFGWAMVFRKPEPRAFHARILIFVVLVFLMWLVWSSVSLWDPKNFALRTAFVSETFLIFYAAYGLQELISATLSYLGQFKNSIRPRNIILIGAAILSSVPALFEANQLVLRSSHTDDFYIPAQIGSWLNRQIEPRDSVLILSDDPLQPYALATYTFIPFDSILDDRLDPHTIKQKLDSSRRVFIVGLFHSTDGLSNAETTIFDGLYDGTILADAFEVSGKTVWVVSGVDMISLRYMK